MALTVFKGKLGANIRPAVYISALVLYMSLVTVLLEHCPSTAILLLVLTNSPLWLSSGWTVPCRVNPVPMPVFLQETERQRDKDQRHRRLMQNTWCSKRKKCCNIILRVWRYAPASNLLARFVISPANIAALPRGFFNAFCKLFSWLPAFYQKGHICKYKSNSMPFLSYSALMHWKSPRPFFLEVPDVNNHTCYQL